MVINFIDVGIYINSIKCKAKWKKKQSFFFLKQIHIVNSTTFNLRNNGAMILWIVTGVGGNLVAIQASRMSTYLHCWSAPGTLPSKMNGNCPRPCATFCSTGQKKLLFCFACTEKLPYSATRENPQMVDTLSSVTITKIISKKKIYQRLNGWYTKCKYWVWINTFGRTGSTMTKKQTKNNRNSSDILSPAIPPIRRLEETSFKFTKEQTLKTQNPLSEGGKV